MSNSTRLGDNVTKAVQKTSKVCYICKIEKPVSEFNKQNKSRKKDGLDSYCRDCRRKVFADYYKLQVAKRNQDMDKIRLRAYYL